MSDQTIPTPTMSRHTGYALTHGASMAMFNDGVRLEQELYRERQKREEAEKELDELCLVNKRCVSLSLELTTLRTQLAEMGKWQPMETAPKDGTAILALLPESDVSHAVFYGGRNVRGTTASGWYVAWDHSILSKFDQPTHWMPLPQPPTAQPMPEPTQQPGEKPKE